MPSGLRTRRSAKERSSFSITSRAAWIPSRRLSTVDWTPLSAPSAAAIETAGGQDVVCDWTFFITSTSGRGATAQPIRKPVIP